MAENYKLLYENMKKIVAMYQDSIVPGLREQLEKRVEVVRCKDCKHYREGKIWDGIKFCFRLRGNNGEPVGYNYCDDDYCSYGERRAGNDNQ